MPTKRAAEPSVALPPKRRRLKIRLVSKGGLFACEYPGCTKTYSRAYDVKRHAEVSLLSPPYEIKTPLSDVLFRLITRPRAALSDANPMRRQTGSTRMRTRPMIMGRTRIVPTKTRISKMSTMKMKTKTKAAPSKTGRKTTAIENRNKLPRTAPSSSVESRGSRMSSRFPQQTNTH